jgi:integrase
LPIRSINNDSAFKKRGCSGNLRSQPQVRLVCADMTQGVLRGQTISMTVTDLFKNDHAFLVENEWRLCRMRHSRHTYSTLLRATGADIKVMQELLRHASARVTLDTYTQAITDKKRRAQTKVVRLLVSREKRKK